MADKSVRLVCQVILTFYLTVCTMKGAGTHRHIHWASCTESSQNKCPLIAM